VKSVSHAVSLLTVIGVVAVCDEPGAPSSRVASVTVSPANDSVFPRTTLQLAAALKDNAGGALTGFPIAWSSSDTTIARISTGGLLTARAPGAVAVTATADGVAGAAQIKVLVAAAAVVVTPESAWVDQGAGVQLTAEVKDSTGSPIRGRAVTWTTNNPSKLTISTTGLATGIAAADVLVTARSGTATGTATIRVKGPVASVTIVPTLDTLLIGDSTQLTAIPKDAAGHPRTDRPVNWSSAGYQAIVSPTGVAYGVAAGTTFTRATVDGVTGSGTIVLVMDTIPSIVQATMRRTCALSALRVTYCWGDIAFPVPGLTDGDQTVLIPAAVRFPTTLAFRTLIAAPTHTCGTTGDGAAHCWGSNQSGQLGNDTLSHQCTNGVVCAPTPVPVLGGLTFATLAGGMYDSCGLVSDGTAYCWGGNVRGEVGDGSTTLRGTPTPVSGGLRFRSISVGRFHTCGITTDSLAYCWGDNSHGQLGIGSIDDLTHQLPEPVVGNRRFVSITLGAAHSCAVTDGAVLYCWGAHGSGQLGAGDSPAGCVSTGCGSPLQAGAGSFVTASAGEFHTCALTGQGAAYCWGNGTAYQLGDGSGINMSTPRLVLGGLTWRSISAGDLHTCGVTVQNVAYCWGASLHALGTGDALGVIEPTRVLGQR
jgi:alpha-tubulin suppressor-like RCC1 family protein/uncharacterized protein YjdB